MSYLVALIYFLFLRRKRFCCLKTNIFEHSHLGSWEVLSQSPAHQHCYISKAVQTSKNLWSTALTCFLWEGLSCPWGGAIRAATGPADGGLSSDSLLLTLALCFHPSHILFYLLKKPLCQQLDGSRTDAPELCFKSIFTLRQNSIFRGMVGSKLFLRGLWVFIKYIQPWCIIPFQLCYITFNNTI